MNWEQIKETVYYEDGSLRDIIIGNTTVNDWEKWVNYVIQYRLKWFNPQTQSKQDSIDFKPVRDFLEDKTDLTTSVNVFIDNLQINAHFFDPAEIENNIDPREFKSIADHETLLKFMKDISILLNKEIILTSENAPEDVLIIVNKNVVTFPPLS